MLKGHDNITGVAQNDDIVGTLHPALSPLLAAILTLIKRRHRT